MERSAADTDQQKILSTGIDGNAASTSVATDCEIQSTTIQTDMEAASISVNIVLAEPSTSSKTDSVIPSSSSRIDFRHTEPLIYDDINNEKVLSNNAVFIEKDSKYKRRYKAIAKENCRLRRQLKLQSRQFKNTLEQKVKNILNGIFTPGQIKMLLNPTIQKMRWSADDIAAAISLRSVSPKAYRYLQNVLKIPLPGLSTLRKWASTFCVDEGILTDVFKVIKYKGRDMSDVDKLTVVSFDEIHQLPLIGGVSKLSDHIKNAK